MQSVDVNVLQGGSCQVGYTLKNMQGLDMAIHLRHDNFFIGGGIGALDGIHSNRYAKAMRVVVWIEGLWPSFTQSIRIKTGVMLSRQTNPGRLSTVFQIQHRRGSEFSEFSRYSCCLNLWNDVGTQASAGRRPAGLGDLNTGLEALGWPCKF